MIEAVFFDGDQTLWDFQKLMRTALEQTLLELQRLRPCVATQRLRLEEMIADRSVVADQFRGTLTKLEEIRRAAFGRTLSRIGLSDGGLATYLTRYYLERRFADVLLYPDVVPSLTRLRARFRLGLLSNGNGHPDRAGLAGTFSAVVFSQDHGIEKPDQGIFDVAARQIDVPPHRIVMVGDSLVKDVHGAQAAGWHGVWLNRDGQISTDQPAPCTIVSLEELAPLLAGWARSAVPGVAGPVRGSGCARRTRCRLTAT